MELPFLLEHGERVHLALVALAAALGALGARRRRLRARHAQARTQRGALGEAQGVREEGPATLRGRLRGGEGEAAAHDDPHTATRAERLALETEAGRVAIDGAVRVEVGSAERVGHEGTAPRRSLRFGDEVLAAGQLERRTREAEGYRSDASEWALVPGGAGVVHLAALTTRRTFVPLRWLVAAPSSAPS
ncbi:MAG TPA: hypothetical protein RMH26_17100, partial [Polyangiaceae bacterium LLY-WYZ-15_(1-7)]|nr:hypothetical protein [Polyangiaceae bacterium LLY-WYZ-15_(1-7)]